MTGALWLLIALVAMGLILVSTLPALQEPPRRWRLASLLIRLLAILLLAFALSDPHLIEKRVPELCVVFAEDRSNSMGSGARSVGRRLLNSLWKTAHAESGKPGIGAVAFARRSAVLLQPGSRAEPSLQDLALGSEGTDIESGIYRALDMVPRGAHGRILLFSDGHENLGNARRASGLARALGFELETAAFSSDEGTVGFEQKHLDLPRRATMGERFPLRLWIENSARNAEMVRVEITRDGSSLVASRALEIPGEGAQLVEIPYKIETRGLHCLRARILRGSGEGDLIDEQLGFIHVVGPPRILLVEPTPFFGPLLSTGKEFQVVPASSLNSWLDEILAYEGVVIRDFAFSSLREDVVEKLARYIFDGGGGLLVAGGRSWIPPRNQDVLPLERLLPVRLKVRKIKGQEGMDLVIVVDTSGSMRSKMAGGKSAIDVAFDAAIRVASHLKPRDRLGVLFFASKSAFTWIKSFSPVTTGDVEMIRNFQLTRSYKLGGGIYVGQALDEVYPKIPITRNRTQHIILITDANDSSFTSRSLPAIYGDVVAYHQQGISLSSVGIEYRLPAKDRLNLQNLARKGGGTYYGVGTQGDIPGIVLEDLKNRERYVRFVQCPVSVYPQPGEDIFGHLSGMKLPPLSGYAISSLAPGGRALLWADCRRLQLDGDLISFKEDDPVLACRSLGLGRVTAMLSSPVAWKGAERFWSQILRGTARPHGQGEYLLSVERDPGGEYRLEAERTAFHEAGAALAGRIVGEDGRIQPLLFQDEGDGRFLARFRARGKSASLLLEEGPGMGFQHIKIHLPHSTRGPPAVMERSPGEPNLDLLSAVGGDAPLNPDTEPSSLLRPPAPRRERVDMKSWCFLGALFLLFLDLGLRRLGGD